MGHDPRKQEALADGYRNWERKSRLTRSTPARGYMLLYWGKIYRKKKTTDKRGSLVGGKVTKGSPHWLWQFVMRVVWGDSKEIFMCYVWSIVAFAHSETCKINVSGMFCCCCCWRMFWKVLLSFTEQNALFWWIAKPSLVEIHVVSRINLKEFQDLRTQASTHEIMSIW